MSARCLGARCHSQPPEGAPHEVVNLRGHRYAAFRFWRAWKA
jgi:hypothetical protein